MKNCIVIICIGAVAAAALISAAYIHKRRLDANDRNCDEVDGGVRHYYDEGAPKSIDSRVITSFSCEGKYCFTDENGNENAVRYVAHAKMEGETVLCTYKMFDRFGYSENLRFMSDGAIMKDLYNLFAKHDLAQFNGISYTVSGLPEGYGAEICIDFESGEHVYSHNNQSCFLSDEFGVELGDVMRHHAEMSDGKS
ncbi:MAG: hypothetical protein IKW68_00780 [Clostridia bacterium]|nr:hypothetical protein [Clostridia bacterium]